MSEQIPFRLSVRNRAALMSESPSWRTVRKLARDRAGVFGVAVVVAMITVAVSAPALRLPDPLSQDMTETLRPLGSSGHPLGTDQFGRDILARIVWGGRVTLVVAFAASLIAFGLGVPLGMTSGYVGGRLDLVVMRSTDLMLAFPYILLALVIVAVSGPGLFNALIAVAITNIPFYIRVTRGIVVTVAHQQYVEAAVAIGATTQRILQKAIFPFMIPYITVAFSVSLGWLILETAGLSFLGLGAQPPSPEWGAMLAEGRTYILIAPHMVLGVGFAIFLLVLTLNLVGDALRDALDVELPG